MHLAVHLSLTMKHQGLVRVARFALGNAKLVHERMHPENGVWGCSADGYA